MPEVATYTIKVTVRTDAEGVEPLRIADIEATVEAAVEDEYDSMGNIVEANATATRDDI